MRTVQPAQKNCQLIPNFISICGTKYTRGISCHKSMANAFEEAGVAIWSLVPLFRLALPAGCRRRKTEQPNVVSKPSLNVSWLVKASFKQSTDSFLRRSAPKHSDEGVPLRHDFLVGRQTIHVNQSFLRLPVCQTMRFLRRWHRRNHRVDCRAANG